MTTSLLPIFPLPNVVFFPKIFLPLHIFEPRYKQLILDALEKEQKIGMILLQEGWQADYAGSPPVCRIGCMGKIEAYEKLPQGRFNILLHGLSRFEIVKFVKEKPYRLAVVNFLNEASSGLTSHEQVRARDALLEKLLLYFHQVLGMELNEERLDRNASLETIVNQVAAILDIPVQKKQQLLEAMTLEKRLGLVQGIVNEGLQYAGKLRGIVQHMRFAPNDPELN